MQRQYIVKIIGIVSDWLSYADGALIKVQTVDAGSDQSFNCAFENKLKEMENCNNLMS